MLLTLLGVSNPKLTGEEGRRRGRYYFWSTETNLFISNQKIEENTTYQLRASINKGKSSCKVRTVRVCIWIMFLFILSGVAFQLLYYGLAEVKFNAPAGSCEEEFDCFHSYRDILTAKNEIGERCTDSLYDEPVVCIRLLTSNFGFSGILWKGMAIAYALYLLITRMYNVVFKVGSFFCFYFSKTSKSSEGDSSGCCKKMKSTTILAIIIFILTVLCTSLYIFTAVESYQGKFLGSQFVPLVVFGALFLFACFALSLTFCLADFEDENEHLKSEDENENLKSECTCGGERGSKYETHEMRRMEVASTEQ